MVVWPNNAISMSEISRTDAGEEGKELINFPAATHKWVWGRCAVSDLYLNTYKAEEIILPAKDTIAINRHSARLISGSQAELIL